MAAPTPEEVTTLKRLLSKATASTDFVAEADLATILSDAFDALCVHDSTDLLLYCIKLCDVLFTDRNGAQFYFVKIGKCESKTNSGQAISAPAALCYRFAEHRKHLGSAFGREMDIFTKKSDLKHNNKQMRCTRSTMTVSDIRIGVAQAPDSYEDFCCIIEATNEKQLKKIKGLYTFRYDQVSYFAEDFNWTEVRLMAKSAFESARAAFVAGAVSMKKFGSILSEAPKFSAPDLAMIYAIDGGDEVQLIF